MLSGRDIATAWDLFMLAFDIQGFACGAILLRLVPMLALWPVAESLLGGVNKGRMVEVSGCPKTPTHFFFHVLLALIKRDAAVEPFIARSFESCGAGNWLQRCLAAAREPAKELERFTAPMTRERRRRREADSA